MNFRILGPIVLGIAVALSVAGCAGTPTQASAGDMLDDSVITAKVKAALLKDPVVSGLAVSVETHKGMVLLNGFVKTAAERDLAQKLAHETAGVTHVINSLQLR